MSDPRTWTPGRGVATRPSPRDTAEVLESLGLPPHALAREVRKATSPWAEQVKLIPVYVLILTGFAAAAVKWDRSVSRDDMNARVEGVVRASDQRARSLELEIEKVERDALSARMAHDALRVEAERRLGHLEDRIRPRRK